MKTLREIYTAYPRSFPLPMVLDGATGTALIKNGMQPGECPEKFVCRCPDTMKKIHREYASAGSDALFAPTFGANSVTLSRNKVEGNAAEINRQLVSAADRGSCLLGGDMSPTGLFIEPFGDADFDDVVSVYAEQASALDKAGVDFFIIETMLDLTETRAAVIGARSVSDKPVFVTLTVDKSGRTLSGDALIPALFTLAELGISAFGCNCSTGPAEMLDSLKPLVSYSREMGIPLIAKPNAGLPSDDGKGGKRFDLSADDFGKYAYDFLKSGIYILGGCCGTDSAYIEKIRSAVNGFSPDELTEASLKIYASTNKSFEEIHPECLNYVDMDEDFPDTLDDFESNVCLRVKNMADAELFREVAYSASKPFAITGLPEAVQYCKRYFNGALPYIDGRRD